MHRQERRLVLQLHLRKMGTRWALFWPVFINCAMGRMLTMVCWPVIAMTRYHLYLAATSFVEFWLTHQWIIRHPSPRLFTNVQWEMTLSCVKQGHRMSVQFAHCAHNFVSHTLHFHFAAQQRSRFAWNVCIAHWQDWYENFLFEHRWRNLYWDGGGCRILG